MPEGADFRLPKIYRFIIKYITPSFLVAILGFYRWQDFSSPKSFMLMKGGAPENVPLIILVRMYLATIFVVLSAMVWAAWRRNTIEEE